MGWTTRSFFPRSFLSVEEIGEALRPYHLPPSTPKQKARQRLEEAKNLVHATRGQDRAIEAQAESDLLDAIAVAEEHGVLNGRSR